MERKKKWVLEINGFELTNDEDGSMPTTLWGCCVVDEGIAFAGTHVSHNWFEKLGEMVKWNVDNVGEILSYEKLHCGIWFFI